MSNYLIQSNFGTKGNFEIVVNSGPLNTLQHWFRDNDRDEPPLGPPWVEGSTFASRVASFGAALIQSNFGTKGDFEVVIVNRDYRLEHWRRDNDDSQLRWHKTATFASRVLDEPALIQSNYGTIGNFEVVFTNMDRRLEHWWRDNDDPQLQWHKTTTFALNANGPPALIQSNFGDNGNFEVVFPNLSGSLEHWWRDNDYRTKPWDKTTTFAPGGSGRPALIQSNFGTKGDFEVVTTNHDKIDHWCRENDDPKKPWSYTFTFGSNAIYHAAALIQSDYGNKGNFEVVYGSQAPSEYKGKLEHWWRNNDNPFKPWFRKTIFARAP
jgi:hypothetical protein